MQIIIAIFIAVFLFSPAHAEEKAESYYGRLMKSCEYNPRSSWRDYLLYAEKKHIDECCAESVNKMAALGAKLAPSDRRCPPHYQINSLKCTSSKTWCEEIKAKTN